MTTTGPPAPILRIFDEAAAAAFYRDFLGFRNDWQHRFEADAPLYLQVSRGACVLHLPEQHGDCCPGAAMRIAVDDLDALHAESSAKAYCHGRPGIETIPWGTRDMRTRDPFGNRLVFTTAVSA